MENGKTLLPDVEDAAPKMHYDDLKYPLLQRGIQPPMRMKDYINARILRDTLSDEDIEAIRQEMVQVFKDAGRDVPFDFHENFDQWFLCDTDDDDQITDATDAVAVQLSSENSERRDILPPGQTQRENETSESSFETSVETSDPNIPVIPRNDVPYRHDDLTIPEQICEYLQCINEAHEASTGEIKAALGGLADSTFKWATDLLIKQGKLERSGYGRYRLIR